MQGVASFPAASVQGIDTAGLSVTRAVSSNREGLYTIHPRVIRVTAFDICVFCGLLYVNDYRIACNFRGTKYSWFSWLEV